MSEQQRPKIKVIPGEDGSVEVCCGDSCVEVVAPSDGSEPHDPRELGPLSFPAIIISRRVAVRSAVDLNRACENILHAWLDEQETMNNWLEEHKRLNTWADQNLRQRNILDEEFVFELRTVKRLQLTEVPALFRLAERTGKRIILRMG